MIAIAFLGYRLSLTLDPFTTSVDMIAALAPLVISDKLKQVLKSRNINNPEAAYENLHQTEDYIRAVTGLRTLKGIYVVINLVTGSIYVGSSIYLLNRMRQHMFYGRGNKLVTLAIAKYGLENIENFAFVVIETVSNPNTIIAIEQYYMLKPEYNINPNAGVVALHQRKLSNGLEMFIWMILLELFASNHSDEV